MWCSLADENLGLSADQPTQILFPVNSRFNKQFATSADSVLQITNELANVLVEVL